MNSWIDLHALWQIVVVGLICGAGLPALFAVGLRALSLGTPQTAPAGTGANARADASVDSDRIVGSSPIGIAAAAVCFGVVLAAIGWGIYLIVAAT
jgi:hypothetical protein